MDYSLIENDFRLADDLTDHGIPPTVAHLGAIWGQCSGCAEIRSIRSFHEHTTAGKSPWVLNCGECRERIKARQSAMAEPRVRVKPVYTELDNIPTNRASQSTSGRPMFFQSGPYLHAMTINLLNSARFCQALSDFLNVGLKVKNRPNVWSKYHFVAWVRAKFGDDRTGILILMAGPPGELSFQEIFKGKFWSVWTMKDADSALERCFAVCQANGSCCQLPLHADVGHQNNMSQTVQSCTTTYALALEKQADTTSENTGVSDIKDLLMPQEMSEVVYGTADWQLVRALWALYMTSMKKCTKSVQDGESVIVPLAGIFCHMRGSEHSNVLWQRIFHLSRLIQFRPQSPGDEDSSPPDDSNPSDDAAEHEKLDKGKGRAKDEENPDPSQSERSDQQSRPHTPAKGVVDALGTIRQNIAEHERDAGSFRDEIRRIQERRVSSSPEKKQAVEPGDGSSGPQEPLPANIPEQLAESLERFEGDHPVNVPGHRPDLSPDESIKSSPERVTVSPNPPVDRPSTNPEESPRSSPEDFPTNPGISEESARATSKRLTPVAEVSRETLPEQTPENTLERKPADNPAGNSIDNSADDASQKRVGTAAENLPDGPLAEGLQNLIASVPEDPPESAPEVPPVGVLPLNRLTQEPGFWIEQMIRALTALDLLSRVLAVSETLRLQQGSGGPHVSPPPQQTDTTSSDQCQRPGSTAPVATGESSTHTPAAHSASAAAMGESRTPASAVPPLALSTSAATGEASTPVPAAPLSTPAETGESSAPTAAAPVPIIPATTSGRSTPTSRSPSTHCTRGANTHRTPASPSTAAALGENFTPTPAVPSSTPAAPSSTPAAPSSTPAAPASQAPADQIHRSRPHPPFPRFYRKDSNGEYTAVLFDPLQREWADFQGFSGVHAQHQDGPTEGSRRRISVDRGSFSMREGGKSLVKPEEGDKDRKIKKLWDRFRRREKKAAGETAQRPHRLKERKALWLRNILSRKNKRPAKAGTPPTRNPKPTQGVEQNRDKKAQGKSREKKKRDLFRRSPKSYLEMDSEDESGTKKRRRLLRRRSGSSSAAKNVRDRPPTPMIPESLQPRSSRRARCGGGDLQRSSSRPDDDPHAHRGSRGDSDGGKGKKSPEPESSERRDTEMSGGIVDMATRRSQEYLNRAPRLKKGLFARSPSPGAAQPRSGPSLPTGMLMPDVDPDRSRPAAPAPTRRQKGKEKQTEGEEDGGSKNSKAESKAERRRNKAEAKKYKITTESARSKQSKARSRSGAGAGRRQSRQSRQTDDNNNSATARRRNRWFAVPLLGRTVAQLRSDWRPGNRRRVWFEIMGRVPAGQYGGRASVAQRDSDGEGG